MRQPWGEVCKVTNIIVNINPTFSLNYRQATFFFSKLTNKTDKTRQENCKLIKKSFQSWGQNKKGYIMYADWPRALLETMGWKLFGESIIISRHLWLQKVFLQFLQNCRKAWMMCHKKLCENTKGFFQKEI